MVWNEATSFNKNEIAWEAKPANDITLRLTKRKVEDKDDRLGYWHLAIYFKLDCSKITVGAEMNGLLSEREAKRKGMEIIKDHLHHMARHYNTVADIIEIDLNRGDF